ncbi:hypothetical protein M413DRAFT_13964 [Hebeloma cylindrosporum]|uniref:Uncharacterized protein n=1 Tax=Hebeloma cylindrosporum TaxID=76867 RepID=A0A0C2Y5Y4_HEBCY|nr:hypothetical protein M413DRAFT_13964 [Hebeloma cylindrosporum h7]
MGKTPSASLSAQKKKAALPVTFQELAQIEKNARAQHLKAERTTKKYGEMVAAARKWLAREIAASSAASSATHCDESPSSGLDHESLDNRNPFIQPEFAAAFDEIPNASSPTALRNYITYKVIHQKLKSGTGDSIRAAFKHMWDQSSGNLYRGKWHFNTSEKRWEGSLIDTAEVADLTKALKNKSGAHGGDRTHSAAMSKEHMEKVFAWSQRICPSGSGPALNLEQRKLKTKHLGFRGFSATAWTVWSRCFELIKAQMKHLRMRQENPNAFGLKYHAFRLVDRKGWQHKISKNERELDLRSNTFNMYDRPDLGACNAYRALEEWISFLEEEVYKRPLDPEDYIFPAMGANGVVHPREPISHDTIQKYIDEFTHGAGIAQATFGRFSTHCFRRGGAQYYFMFAPVGKRWSLRKVRWWGGWAEGEHGETLIRYLLDELHSYEEDFCDALCPVQVERDVTFMAEHHAVAPVNNETVGIMHSQLAAQIRSIHDEMRIAQQQIHLQLQASLSLNAGPSNSNILAQVHPAPPMRQSPESPAFPGQHHIPQPTPFSSGPASHAHPIHPIPAITCFPTSTQPSASTLLDRPRLLQTSQQGNQPTFSPRLPTHASIIPDIPVKNADGTRPHARESWRYIVAHWRDGDPERGLAVPLKDWPADWLRGPNRLLASKHNQRAKIAKEFLVQYDGDESKFLAAYPEAEEGHTRLYTAIQEARKARGDFAPRVRA